MPAAPFSRGLCPPPRRLEDLDGATLSSRISILPHLAHELQRKFHITQFPHAPIEELKVIVSGADLSYFLSRKSSSSCLSHALPPSVNRCFDGDRARAPGACALQLLSRFCALDAVPAVFTPSKLRAQLLTGLPQAPPEAYSGPVRDTVVALTRNIGPFRT